jgi:putative Holliday junction resolvase
MARLLGIDYGSRRIGLAISDPDQIIATPLAVVQAEGQPVVDAAKLAQLAPQHEVAEFVIGLPLNKDGSEGKQARVTRDMGEALAQATSLPVHFYDERYTTHAAIGAMRQAEVRRRQRGGRLDKVAASIMLQAFLDARRHAADEAGDGRAPPSALHGPNNVDPPVANS